MPAAWGRVVRVMASPQRHPKTGILRFRQAVPRALQGRVAELLGMPAGTRKHELIRTLATRDVREARERLPAAEQWANELLTAAREGACPLTERQAQALAGVWHRRRVEEWEADPTKAEAWRDWDAGLPESPYASEDVTGPIWEASWSRFLSLHMAEVDEVLAAEGLVTDAASKRRLAELIVRRLPQTLALHERRRRGDYGPDPIATELPAWERPSEKPPEDAPAVPLGTLLIGWKAVAVVKSRTVTETAYAVDLLIAFLGHDDAARIAPDDLRRWREASKTGGITNNTWNNRLSLLRQLFIHGASEGLLKEDPTTGLRLRKSKPQSPLPYTDADAALILNAARQETRPALRWAHWVMAFTGMRAGEVLQLTGGDVRQDAGIWFLALNEDDEGKSIKTGQRRHVPVHPALIAEGFIAYAQTIGTDAPVFPDKGLDRHGNRGGRAWNLLGKWARNIAGITDSRKAPNHSWRHRMEDELRAAEVPEDVRDAILGHARKTVGRQYGVRKEALKRLYQALSRIPVPPGVPLCEAGASLSAKAAA